MQVLNVGGGSRVLPARYDGWEQTLLDIDMNCGPDLCMDALDLVKTEGAYDAIYCSHNLEHFYRHDVPKLLEGFDHVLSPSGFVHVIVPNLRNLMDSMASSGLEPDDVWYRVGGGAVTFHDVLYGWDAAMSKGNLFYAHKSGYFPGSLKRTLEARFPVVDVFDCGPNIVAFAYKSEPEVRQCP